MSKLVLKNINKIFDKSVVAVKDFSLEIADKEFIILVGPSGCGKSTTLRMIAGLEEITKGDLYIDDELMNDVTPKDRDIAMVFQNYALYPHMTVEQNLGFALKMRKIPKKTIKEKVMDVAKMLDIEPYLKRKPKALSGGQRQRVALGRACVRDPKVFLFDEPLSNLDAKLRTQMRMEIAHLHKKLDTTFIYVTHDQVEAMTMGTKIVVMKDGEIQQVDTPIQLYDEPVNLFVATFIGTPQMNILDVCVELAGDRLDLKFKGSKISVPNSCGIYKALCHYDGQEIYVGVRPEKIRMSMQETDEIRSGIVANVDIIEQMGCETLLYMRVSEQSITAKVLPHTPVKSGDRVLLDIQPQDMFFFDKKTKQRIKNSNEA